jgi:hypothetical protein
MYTVFLDCPFFWLPLRFSVAFIDNYSNIKLTLENTEGSNKNEHSSETCNIEYTRRRQTASTWVHPRFDAGVRVTKNFSVLCCPIMCIYILSSVCDVRDDFRIQTMCGSSLPPVVGRVISYLLYLCLLAHSGVQYILVTRTPASNLGWTHVLANGKKFLLLIRHPKYSSLLVCFLLCPSIYL